jgi:lipopolysaccharide transport system permease protein
MTLTEYFSLVNLQARMALKADAAQYFFGYIWWVLEPLLYVGVFLVVFNIFLDSKRADFLVFLMCGKLPFIWFSKSVSHASRGIVSNAGLIGRIDIPKSLFPMAIIHQALHKQMAVFALLFAVLVLNDYQVGWVWFWLAPIIVVNYLLIVGCAFLGSILVCFMRDFSMFISLGMIFLMFTSGIFWDIRTMADPQMTELILVMNPIAFLLDSYRQVLMYGQPPDVFLLTMNGLGSGLMVVVMLFTLRRWSKLLALKALTA